MLFSVGHQTSANNKPALQQPKHRKKCIISGETNGIHSSLYLKKINGMNKYLRVSIPKNALVFFCSMSRSFVFWQGISVAARSLREADATVDIIFVAAAPLFSQLFFCHF